MQKTKKHTILFVLIGLVFVCGGINQLHAEGTIDDWPQRVLITNDNGIEDIKIIELAREFAKIAETYVVAPSQDRSGSTHYQTATRIGSLNVERRQIGEGITAYAVDGFPADCVMLALTGIMQDNPPDLVISGINGGSNTGIDWLFSGTVGAARVASFGGIPAIAVSGMDDSMADAVVAANRWVVRLAQSPLVRELKPLQYLTVSLPRLHPEEIKGVRVTKRAGLIQRPVFEKVSDGEDGGTKETWRIVGVQKTDYTLPSDSDVALDKEGYIVVVPMISDEHDYKLLAYLKENLGKLPEWKSQEGKN